MRAASEIALHVVRGRVARTTERVIKFTKKCVEAESRMRKEKKRAHQAIADLTLAFDRIVWPEFGKDKRMFKKKQTGLPAWWRNKISAMGHPSLLHKLERGATIRAKAVIDPSEAGTSRVHNCSNPDCQSKAFRDGSGRSIAAMMFARILCFRDKPIVEDVQVEGVGVDGIQDTGGVGGVEEEEDQLDDEESMLSDRMGVGWVEE
jgi:hypothetical protein